MTRDIREYVLSCPKYQQVKSTTGTIVPPLTMWKVTSHPFHTLITDAVEPFPKSQGYEYLVCVANKYSTYIIT